jgi:hypothetical protein
VRIAVMLAAALGVLVAVVPSETGACTCIETEPEGSYRAAAAVFEGRWTSGDTDHATFRVVRIWKGLDDNPTRVRVQLGEHFALCSGFPESDFVEEAGTAHLVYATAGDGGLVVGACGRYFPSARGAEELASLEARAPARTPIDTAEAPHAAPARKRSTEPPAIVPPPSPPPPRARGCRVGARAAPPAALILGLLALARRRRRAP